MNNIISTLLDDTLRCIALSGHTVEQIVFIGTESGYSLSWDEFASMTAQHPHIGEIARDIVIEFSDGKTMWRDATLSGVALIGLSNGHSTVPLFRSSQSLS